MNEPSVGTPSTLTARARIGLLLILLALTGGIYLVLLLVTTPQLQSFAPGHQITDLTPAGLSHQATLGLYDALGFEGRDYYLHVQLPIDMIYPALFMASLGLLLATLTRYLQLPFALRLTALLPILAGGSDWAENALTWRALRTYPEISPTLPQLGSWFTVVKTTSVVLTLVLCLGFGLWAVARRRRLAAGR